MIEKYKKLYSIPFNERYMINKNGDIFDLSKSEIIQRVYKKNIPYVVLVYDDTIQIIKLAKLVLSVFIGELHYKILYKDHDKSNVNIDNLQYIIPDNDIKTLNFNGTIFKKIPLLGLEKYAISTNGILFSANTMKLLHRDFDKDGYVIMKLRPTTSTGQQQSFRIHRLVLLTYLGPAPDMQVNHIDGRVYNNDISNLEYLNQTDNTRHAYAIGLIPNQIFTPAIASFICNLLYNYVAIEDILQVFSPLTPAEKYRLVGNIRHLIHSHSWREFSEKILSIDYYGNEIHLTTNQLETSRGVLKLILQNENVIRSSTTIENVTYNVA